MLDKVEHARILADFERVCTIAGVQGRFMYESMTKHCLPMEIDWVRKFWQYKAAGVGGLVLEGVARPDTRCQSMAAALVRNYIDARVMPLNTVLDRLDEGTMVEPTVLLIPNLYVSATAKNVPPWKVQAIYDLLLLRSVRAKPCVLYVESMDGLMKLYGQPFADFLHSYKTVKQ